MEVKELLSEVRTKIFVDEDMDQGALLGIGRAWLPSIVG